MYVEKKRRINVKDNNVEDMIFGIWV